MAFTISPSQIFPRKPFQRVSTPPPILSPSSFRFPVKVLANRVVVVCSASSAGGSSTSSNDLDPYEVLGVSPIAGFEKIKTAYSRKRKDAERKGDEATATQLEMAYDKIMMSQLTERKKGVTFGSFKVSKEIKYADKQPIVSWGPRFSKSEHRDMQINMALSAVFTAWVFIKRNAEWKPLQFLAFVFVYRIFEKLKALEPPPSLALTEEADNGRMLRMGKRLLRSLGLAFGCIAVSSLGYTGILNLIEFTGRFIPAIIYNNQEVIVTTATAILLYITASYYR
ncbi:unnamed protein product [Cuscuta epithymum]|uniref:Chloroplast J-like domain 1 n=1 Tax=Cuscuta epithymum TaxID=186058 RepID=A0AAV0GFS3_9ASTE|nr:unnamed protein product [Cuscuta epithymum]